MRRAALVAAGFALAAGAASAAPGSPSAERPIVLAAASLTEVLPRIAPDGRYSFGSSNALAEQIGAGALRRLPVGEPAVSAGTRRRPRAQAGRVRDELARPDRPEVEPGEDQDRRRPREAPEAALVVAGPKVPIGLYTREVLKRLGMLKVLKKTVSLEPDVKGSSARSPSGRRMRASSTGPT